jgi:hypothetical protein
LSLHDGLKKRIKIKEKERGTLVKVKAARAHKAIKKKFFIFSRDILYYNLIGNLI